MSMAFNIRFAVILLCIPCDTIAMDLQDTVMNSALKRSILSPEHNEVYINDVITTVSSLSRDVDMELKLLYDQHYSGAVNDIVRMSRDINGVTMLAYDGTNEPLLRLLKPASYPALLLVLCTVQNIVNIFRMIHRQKLHGHLVDWLLMLPNSDATETVTSNLQDILTDAFDITIMTRERRGTFTIFSTRVDEEGFVKLKKSGKCNLKSPFGRSKLPYLIGRDEWSVYSNMQGRELKVSVVSNYGLCTLGQVLPDGSVEALSGTDIATVRALGDALNFTIRTVYPPDKTYGNPLPNGTVTGMVGMAARREVAFSTCSIAVSNRRKTAVDFAYPYVRGSLGIFSRAPKQKNRALAVLSPFTLEVWICIVVFTLTIGPIMSVQSKFSQTSGKHDGSRWDLQWNSLNMFRSLVVQGNRIQAEHWSQRILLFAWFLACLTIWASYSGMLTAVLAIPEFETPVNSLLDLPRAVDEGFTLGVLKDSANEYLFREAKGGIYKQTWNLFNHDDRSESFVDGNSAGMKRVFDRDYIYIGFKLVCEILATRWGRSKIHVARETLFDHSLSLALPPGAPYQKIFSDKLMRMVEGGLTTKWKDEEFARISQGSSGGPSGKKSRAYAITVTHLQAAFFVIVLGTLVALIALAVENAVWHSKKRQLAGMMAF